MKGDKKMATLPDGLEDNAMIAAVAWEIVNYAYLRTAYFNNMPSDEVFVKLTNAYLTARQAIYHGEKIKSEDIE